MLVLSVVEMATEVVESVTVSDVLEVEVVAEEVEAVVAGKRQREEWEFYVEFQACFPWQRERVA